MKGPQVTDLHVEYNVPLPAPALVMHEMPRTEAQANLVVETRERIAAILRGESDRFLVVVGPCFVEGAAMSFRCKVVVVWNSRM